MGGSAPKAPDPKEVASAQTGTNVGTAVANQTLGFVNQNTPQGSLTYNQTGTKSWTDPVSGKTYDLPQYTANQTLSPQEQGIYDANARGRLNLANLGADQSQRLGKLLGTPMDMGAAPKVSAPQLRQVGRTPSLVTSINSGPIQRRIAPAGNIQSNFGDAGRIQGNFADAGRIDARIADAGRIQGSFADAGRITSRIADAGRITGKIADAGRIDSRIANAGKVDGTIKNSGDITRSYSTDFSQDRQKVEDALMQRMNPSLEQERDRLATQLSNQGIKLGSEAYDRAMAQLSQRNNDARLGAILGAGEEQSRMVGMEANRAQFQNNAQQQQFGQNATQTEMLNLAQQQRFGQNATQTEFNLAGQQQRYGQASDRARFANEAQGQRYGQASDRARFQNESQQQRYGQNLGRAEFANNAQAQRFGQAATRTEFGLQGQAQRYGQNLGRAEFANNAQQQRYGQNLGRAQFSNEAQSQRFGQNAAQGAFGNAAEAQRFGQNLSGAQFRNQGLQQMFGNGLAQIGANNAMSQQQFSNQRLMRGDYLGEQYAARNQPINEIAALLGGGQMQAPQFASTPTTQMPTVDYAGLTQQGYQNQLAAYQQRQQGLGGLFGLASAGIGLF